MSEDRHSFKELVRNINQGNEIENTVKELEKQGIPEHTAYYAASMAFLRRRKK